MGNDRKTLRRTRKTLAGRFDFFLEEGWTRVRGVAGGGGTSEEVEEELGRARSPMTRLEMGGRVMPNSIGGSHYVFRHGGVWR